ncbi:MAG: preprotein translocase subunit YajC [Eubacteriales bacterium]|nr:preprotein translocase subunit YajC [Eubacteriales bacterium]
MGTTGGLVVWFLFLIAMIYFMMIRPQQKEKKKQEALFASLAIGDAVLTTAGFYGQIIDMTADTVIVEFGNNKNCRIPMQKAAIVKVEKPKYSTNVPEKKEDK